MFGNSTIVLGSETDDKLFEALKIVLASYNAEVKENSYSVVGSQEITIWEVKINSNKLKVCSETYEGLSIKGSTKLINEIKIKVERQFAI